VHLGCDFYKIMKTVAAFTCGTGRYYCHIVERAVKRFSALNPINVINISEQQIASLDIPSAHWVKAYLWDFVDNSVNTIIWFDADIIPIQTLSTYSSIGFSACLEPNKKVAKAVQERFLIRNVFNTGFFIADRSSQQSFERLKTKRKDKPCGLSFYEQSPLCKVLEEDGTKIEILPARYNWSYAHNGMYNDKTLMWHFFCSHNKIEKEWKRFEL